MKQKKEEEERIKDGVRRWENGVKGMIKKGAALLRPPSFAKTDNLGLAEQEQRWWLLPPWLSRMVGEVGQFLLGWTHDVVFWCPLDWTSQAGLPPRGKYVCLEDGPHLWDPSQAPQLPDKDEPLANFNIENLKFKKKSCTGFRHPFLGFILHLHVSEDAGEALPGVFTPRSKAQRAQPCPWTSNQKDERSYLQSSSPELFQKESFFLGVSFQKAKEVKPSNSPLYKTKYTKSYQHVREIKRHFTPFCTK